MRVVIAEDAAVMREGLARLLEDRGHEVVATVADGDALLEAASRHHPDAAVVDIRMPPTHTDEGLRAAGASLDASLTPREGEVLSLMAEGRSNAGIADRLVIGEGAVEKHVANIFAKLGLPVSENDNRRVLAVLRYLQS